MGRETPGAMLRALMIPFFFQRMEQAFAASDDPLPALHKAVHEATATLTSLGSLTELRGIVPLAEHVAGVEQSTAEHYGRLFENFDAKSYFEEPANLLRARLERNGIPLESIQGKRVLDDGCGGGRYSAAWKKLGAGEVVGCDLSSKNIETATKHANGVAGLRFMEADCLNLPFKDGEFEIVFSNGVLHHTTDCARGIRELVRVLRQGGMGWLYLIEAPGGLFWRTIDVLRSIIKGDSSENAQFVLLSLGLRKNRVFYMLDHVFVPINLRLTAEEISGMLRAAGATDIRRLERGADFDRVEQIYRREPFAREKYGVGEHRFVFTKK